MGFHEEACHAQDRRDELEAEHGSPPPLRPIRYWPGAVLPGAEAESVVERMEELGFSQVDIREELERRGLA